MGFDPGDGQVMGVAADCCEKAPDSLNESLVPARLDGVVAEDRAQYSLSGTGGTNPVRIRAILDHRAPKHHFTLRQHTIITIITINQLSRESCTVPYT